MYFTHRRLVFKIFVILFLLLSPFLTVYSLGYGLDLSQRKLNHSVDITLQTTPSGALVKANNSPVITTTVIPTRLTAKDGYLIHLEVEKEGFLKERLDLWGQPGTNTTARVNPLVLLPEEFNISFKDPEKKLLSIVTENLVLYQQKNQLMIQLYSFSGLLGNPEMVVTELLDINKILPSFWTNLSNNLYWQEETNLLLYKRANLWYLLDLGQTNLLIQQIARVDNETILVLDLENKVWLLDLPNNLNLLAQSLKKINFLIGDIQGLTFTRSPDIIWFLRKGQIFAVPRENVRNLSSVLEYRELDSYEYTNLSTSDLVTDFLAANKIVRFLASYAHQGLVFQVDQKLYYVPDFAKNIPVLIGPEVFSWFAAGSSLFWLDRSFNLYVQNLNLNIQKFLSQFNLDSNLTYHQLRIFYYSKWKRLFIFTPKEVYALWFDKDIFNETIVAYYPVLWVSQASCLSRISNDYQFCLLDGQLINYNNTYIW